MYAFYILVLTFAVFFLQQVFPIEQFLILTPATVLAQPYTLITSIFLHGGIAHIIFNMFALLIFGPILESRIGSKKFLMLYLGAGIAGNIGYILTGGTLPALGASGAIFGILGALAILEPNMIVFVGFIPMPMYIAAIFWIITEFLYTLAPSNIANWAHLFGLFVGLYYGWKLKAELPPSHHRYGRY